MLLSYQLLFPYADLFVPRVILGFVDLLVKKHLMVSYMSHISVKQSNRENQLLLSSLPCDCEGELKRLLTLS